METHVEYRVIWRDVNGRRAVSGFHAADDELAVGLAGNMSSLSKATIESVIRISELSGFENHPPQNGYDRDVRVLFLYRTANGNAIRVNVPAFNLQALELDGKETLLDLIGGLPILLTKHGTPAEAFIRGRYWEPNG